ncbi:hypothetical protein PFLUV_G00278720 [Perca fluviatilis]|uniref:Uncharacterized protein n=1 Tax=Perca fluviatilis TaxID=8168 RepID=A0A6A5E5W1_PERFL|nr:hypothetical protein PFLUV_G00278720 [Perca fluviatilis]
MLQGFGVEDQGSNPAVNLLRTSILLCAFDCVGCSVTSQQCAAALQLLSISISLYFYHISLYWPFYPLYLLLVLFTSLL